MSKTLTVIGEGKFSVKPDLVMINLVVESQNNDYDKAVEKTSLQINDLKNKLLALEFDENSLKTTDFRVRTDYKNERSDDGTYKNVFNGFVCTHTVVLEFGFDSKILSDVIGTILKSQADPHVSISFTARNNQSVRDKIIELAVEDAKHKAQVIAKASNVELKCILSISYGKNDIDLMSGMRYTMDKRCMSLAENASYDSHIEPENINLSDTVTVQWEIE